MSSIGKGILPTLAALLWGSAPASAQDRIFPRLPSFELPAASPRVHGIVGRVISAQQGESRFGREAEAEVALGENVPVIALRRGARPITLGLGTAVYARFSLDDPRSAMISNDWVVGVNTTAVLDAWALTLELYHESSHLGDEYGDRFNVTRLDWTREVAAGWASYTSGLFRVTGGVSYVLLDALGLARPGSSFAGDFRGRPLGRVLGGQLKPIAGLYVEANAATRWRMSTSAKLGFALGSSEGREVGIALIAHDGLSTQRQFFRQESRYVGMELKLDL